MYLFKTLLVFFCAIPLSLSSCLSLNGKHAIAQSCTNLLKWNIVLKREFEGYKFLVFSRSVIPCFIESKIYRFSSFFEVFILSHTIVCLAKQLFCYFNPHFVPSEFFHSSLSFSKWSYPDTFEFILLSANANVLCDLASKMFSNNWKSVGTEAVFYSFQKACSSIFLFPENRENAVVCNVRV